MQFYVLDPQAKDSKLRTDFFNDELSKVGQVPKCAVCGGNIGMLPVLPPRRVELKVWGRHFGDLAFGTGDDLLVSERFRDAFVRSGLVGFSGFAPAEIVKVVARLRNIPIQLPSYFVAVPGRSRAAVDDRASGLEYEKRWTCEECRIGSMMRLRRLVLEPGTWSGEDVFIARGLPGTIITSERFKKFCEQGAFTNCVLVEAAHYHFDVFPGLAPPTDSNS
jgi:Immunity protein family (Imm11)